MRPLTSGLISDWSPDGRKIAFDDGDNNHVEVFTMNADGTDRQRVTHLAGITGDPSWSPDGNLLVFDQFTPNGCCANIWTIHPDGTGLHKLTQTSGNPAAEPEFSPDGRQIVFTQTLGGANLNAIFVMRADGGDIRQVTPLPMYAGHPKWSPDGRRIIFNNDFHTLPNGLNVGDIFTIRPDGTGLKRLTDVIPLDEADYRPDYYSPDGTMIVFNQLVPSGHPSVLTMKADGTSPKVILANGFAPDWGPRPSR